MVDGVGKSRDVGGNIPPQPVGDAHEVQESGLQNIAAKTGFKVGKAVVLSKAMNAAVSLFTLVSPRMKGFIKDGRVSQAKADKAKGAQKDLLAENSFGVISPDKGEVA